MKTFNPARWTFVSAAAFIVFLVMVHFINPELDPSRNFISEYQVGKFGWIMQLAFIAIGASCIFLALTLWKNVGFVGKIGVVMLIISAAGMFIAAVFKTDPLNTPRGLITEA